MALSKDLIWWGNQSRREQVVRLHQQVISLMRDSFHAINRLVETLKDHFKNDGSLGAKLHSMSNIVLDNNGDIKQNCDVFLSRVAELQRFYEETNSICKQHLDPHAYELLYEPDREPLKDIEFTGKCVSIPCQLTAGFFMLKNLYNLANAEVLKGLTEFAKFLWGGATASLPVFLYALGIDAAFGLIIGYFEKSNLESLTRSMEELVNKFEPKVRDYVEKIYRAIAITQFSCQQDKDRISR